MSATADRRITYLLKVLTDPKAADAFAQISKMSEGLDKHLAKTLTVSTAPGQSASAYAGSSAPMVKGGEDVKLSAINASLQERETILRGVGAASKIAADGEKEYAAAALAGLRARADVLAAELRNKGGVDEPGELHGDVKADAANAALERRNAILGESNKLQEATANLAAKVATSTKDAAESEAEYARNALAGLHAKADVLAAELRDKAAPKEEAAESKEAELDQKAVDKIIANRIKFVAKVQKFDADKAESAKKAVEEDFKLKTENLKELQAWEDKQTKFEIEAAEKRARAGKRSLDQQASDAQHAAALIREANQKVIDSFGQGVDGVLKLGRAIALTGLIGEEDFGKVRDTILGVQVAIDAAKGGLDAWKSFSSLSTLAKGGGAVAGAAAGVGEVANLSGALAPAVAALGPFALAATGATAAILALKYASDKASDARLAEADKEGRRRADERMGVLHDTRVGSSEEERSKAIRDPDAVVQRGALTEFMMSAGHWITSRTPAAYIPGVQKRIDDAYGETERTNARQGGAEADRMKQISDDQRQQLKEIGARLAANERDKYAAQDKQESAADAMKRFTMPDAKLGLGLDSKAIDSDMEALKTKLATLRKEAAEFQLNPAGAEAVLANVERQEQIERQLIALAGQDLDLKKRTAVEAIEGLKNQLTLQEQIFAKEKAGADAALNSIRDQISAKENAAKSDAERFGELDPFKQKEIAGVLKKKNAGEELSERELRALKDAGFSSTSDFVHKEGVKKGERDLKAQGIGDAFYTESQQKSDRESRDLAAAESNEIAGNAARGRQDVFDQIGKIGGEVNVKSNGEFVVTLKHETNVNMTREVLAKLETAVKGAMEAQDEKVDQKIRQEITRALQRLGQTRNAK